MDDSKLTRLEKLEILAGQLESGNLTKKEFEIQKAKLFVEDKISGKEVKSSPPVKRGKLGVTKSLIAVIIICLTLLCVCCSMCIVIGSLTPVNTDNTDFEIVPNSDSTTTIEKIPTITVLISLSPTANPSLVEPTVKNENKYPMPDDTGEINTEAYLTYMEACMGDLTNLSKFDYCDCTAVKILYYMSDEEIIESSKISGGSEKYKDILYSCITLK